METDHWTGNVRIAENWFQAHEMGRNITRIREVHLAPAAACNIWHIRGRDRDILFDAGTGLVSLKAHFPALARRPVICIPSHTHFDHAGGACEFDDCRMHGAEADILTAPTRANTTVEGYMDWELFTALPHEGFDPGDYQVRPARPTGLLADGDLLDLGGRTLEVLHLPGHSPGTIGLYEPATRTLFPSDAIYDGRLYDDCYHSSIPDFRASLERLLTLPVSRVHGGHFDSFGPLRLKTLIRTYLDTPKGD